MASVMKQKINVRLPDESIEMLDTAIARGLFATRSEAIRSIVAMFQYMTGPNSALFVPFVAYILENPFTMDLWLKDRRELPNRTVAAVEEAVKSGMTAEPSNELREILAQFSKGSG